MSTFFVSGPLQSEHRHMHRFQHARLTYAHDTAYRARYGRPAMYMGVWAHNVVSHRHPECTESSRAGLARSGHVASMLTQNQCRINACQSPSPPPASTPRVCLTQPHPSSMHMPPETVFHPTHECATRDWYTWDRALDACCQSSSRKWTARSAITVPRAARSEVVMPTTRRSI